MQDAVSASQSPLLLLVTAPQGRSLPKLFPRLYKGIVFNPGSWYPRIVYESWVT